MTSLRTRVLLSPLAVNLAAAIALRLVVPFTLDAGGERYVYYMMSLFFPAAQCTSFHCFRFLPPLLTALLTARGVEVADAFIATGLVFHVLAATVLWHLALLFSASRRAAWWTLAWYWTTWGPIQGFSDPLLITDPVQAFWSVTTLYLLLGRRYAFGLVMLLSGAAVKESVLLIPMIYAAYVVLAKDEARRHVVWISTLVLAPLAVWLLVRIWLHAYAGYPITQEFLHLENGRWVSKDYIRQTYLFGVWLPGLGPWPGNLVTAALYVFGSFGAAWVFAALELWRAGRRQRALSAASIPAMLFLMVYQVPDRALASFPYAVLMPAAAVTAAIPGPIAAALVAVNAAFTLRMNTTVPWLPRTPRLLLFLAAVAAAGLWAGRNRLRRPTRDEGEPPAPPSPVPRLAAGVLTASLVALVLPATRDATHGRVARLEASAGAARVADDEGGTPGLAVSRDGRQLVFVGRDQAGVNQLWIRQVASGDPTPLPGTAAASEPFWAPDGRRIAFFSQGRLKALDLDTRRVVTLAEAPRPRGGTWSGRDVIVFSPSPGAGLLQVRAAGGLATPVGQQGSPGREPSARWPSFLPDDDHFLYVKWNTTDQGLYVASLSSPEVSLVSGSPYAAMFANGFLFNSRGDTLFIEPFDLRRRRLFGLELRYGRLATSAYGRSAFSVGGDTLAVAADTARSKVTPGPNQLRWFDRAGTALDVVGDAGPGRGVQLSPDERVIVASFGDGNQVPMWKDGQRVNLPVPGGQGPLWSPDSHTLAFPKWMVANARTALAIVRRQADSSGPEQVLAGVPDKSILTSWSADGLTLSYHASNAAEGWDIWTLPSVAGARPALLIPGRPSAVQAQFSPDGKWIAYSANDTGRFEVYVQAYPPTGEKHAVTTEGGTQPRWRQDGAELFYVVNGRWIMAVSVQAQPAFRLGEPRPLFEVLFPPLQDPTAHPIEYAVSRDGRFLINRATRAEPSAPLTTVLNWRRAINDSNKR